MNNSKIRFVVPLCVGALGAAIGVLSERPAAAQLLVVPNGCGDYSGLPVPAGMILEDHSNDAVPLGSTAAPHVMPLSQRILVATPFGDVIQGSGVDDVICALGGNDVVMAGDGDDEVFGGNGEDQLWGQANSDLLVGGPQNDELHGDEPGNPNPFDTGDTLRGGQGNDIMFGGDGADTLSGGPQTDSDFGDGNDGADACSGIESGPC